MDHLRALVINRDKKRLANLKEEAKMKKLAAEAQALLAEQSAM